MTFSRRQLLAATAGALIARPLVVLAATQSKPVSGFAIVEIANFECGRCASVNQQFARIEAAARAKHIDLRFAPAAWKGQSLWPDRVYYAARDTFPKVTSLVRDALFQGIHVQGQPFESLAQVRAYFDQESILKKALALDAGFNWEAVAKVADGDAPLWSEVKASRLIDEAMVEETPSFIWLGDGKVYKTVTPKQANEAGALVNTVLQAIALT